MFDLPLFPTFDPMCRRPCRPAPKPCPCECNPCRDNEYLLRICGCDACGNLIVSIKRR